MKTVLMLKKWLVIGIIFLFLGASAIPGRTKNIQVTDTTLNNKTELILEEHNTALITCYTYGLPGKYSKETSVTIQQADDLLDKIKKLQLEVVRNPQSEKTQLLYHEIIMYAQENQLLPQSVSLETLTSQFASSEVQKDTQRISFLSNSGKASEFFCNYVSTGTGSALPVLIFPRLIPILLVPIPRLFVRWSVIDGVTSCGGLRSGTGFIASGQQKGLALGFWGIGFSIFLPPVMMYGLFGYALFASVNADHIEYWPPNYPPETNAISPLDNAINVPITTCELRFSIADINNDLMSYEVTTIPDIGSGNSTLKPDGVYSIPVSNLEGSQSYTWHVQVSDGEDSISKSFSFTTEMVAPVVTNPNPSYNAWNVPQNLSQLRFTLTDFQGDLMDYTVETAPNIGMGSGFGVGNGIYTVDISGLGYSTEYTWYVNVTDGSNWKRTVNAFHTRMEPGEWWDSNWQYRKEFIVNYSMVEGSFTHFPVFIHIASDNNLVEKAQPDGDDIVFTDYFGNKLSHELEVYTSETGHLIAWVNISVLSPETILYMYYGNAGCSNQQNLPGTWSNGYIGVWHMDDNTTGTISDSSDNNYDGTKRADNNPLEVGAYVSQGQDFEINNKDYISTAPCNSVENQWTVSAYVKFESIVTYTEGMINIFSSGSHSNEIALGKEGDPNRFVIRVYSPDGVYTKLYTGATVPTTNVWYYVVSTWDGTNVKIYVNGVEDLPYTKFHDTSGSQQNTQRIIEFGRAYGNDARTLDGILDEARISNVVRSAEWIKTEFNNQNNPNNFWSIGSEELIL